MGGPVLAVRDFSIDLLTGTAARRVVSSVSFDLPARSILGILGPSGCGKTTLFLGMMGLLEPRRYRITGSVKLNGRELVGLSERSLLSIRGAEISIVLQDPALALNPVLRVRDQVSEPARAHGLQADVPLLLRTVGLAEVERIAESYPHQLSGGQRQRVAIAQALACRPQVVMADEPFTGLDSSSVLALTDLLLRVKNETGAAFLVISHNAGDLARIADSVLVMVAGRIERQGSPAEVFP